MAVLFPPIFPKPTVVSYPSSSCKEGSYWQSAQRWVPGTQQMLLDLQDDHGSRPPGILTSVTLLEHSLWSKQGERCKKPDITETT